MSENNEHDLAEIDAFLRQSDNSQGCTDFSRGRKIPEDLNADREKSQVDRLLARATHANKDIGQALDCVAHARESLNGDISLCEKLTFELTNCENALLLLQNMMDADTLAALANSKPEPQAESAANDARQTEADILLKQLVEQTKLIQKLESRLHTLENVSAHGKSAAPRPADIIERLPDEPYVNRVVIASNDQGNLKFPLDKNIVTIGREAENDIHIRSRFISRYHARIVSDRDGAIIEDLGSRNGITVNSRKIKRHQLKSGDLIDLGKTQLKYIDLKEGVDGVARA
jgi:hypothetical protein